MQHLIDQLTHALNTRPTRLRPLSGGCVASVFRADLEDGTSCVVKSADAAHGTLDIEAFMLRYLAEHSRLPVPRVLHAEPSLLVMEFIESRIASDDRSHENAADLLADLHDITAPHFGLDRDTLIGSLPQPNPATKSWVEFFRDHRLLHMAAAARAESALTPRTLDRLSRLADRLPHFLSEPETPSLIHGDIWSGNVLASPDDPARIAAFIDPAIYYADPEIELAFITLFSTFGDRFFRRYAQHRPIRDGFFETRRHIYNLYPLLVHVRLFGGSYAADIDHTLSRLGL